MIFGLNSDGTVTVATPEGAEVRPGDVLGKFAELRSRVGVLKARTKEKVRFKVRSADELVDKIRAHVDELGLLIYPIGAQGVGSTVAGDDGDGSGTFATVTVALRVQAISDGSYLILEGFGLGADNMDKAGGKAGTYAWKAALLQALLAAGQEDTDDTDTPIKGGVRPKAKPVKAPPTDLAAILGRFSVLESGDTDGYKAALADYAKLPTEVQIANKAAVADAKARVFPAASGAVGAGQ